MDTDNNDLRKELAACRDTVAELRHALARSNQLAENSRTLIEHSHQEWVAALDVLDFPIFLHDQDYRILRCNKAYQRHAGMAFDHIIGKPYYEVFPKTAGPLPCCLHAKEKESAEGEEEVTVGATIYRARAFLVRDGQGQHLFTVHMLEDITEKKRAETILQRSNRALLTLSEGNQALIHATEERELLLAMCRAVVEKGGYRMAWVGYVMQDAARSMQTMAQAGFEAGYLDQAHITWDDSEYGRGPVGRAVRSGQTQVAQNIALDPTMSPWHAEAAKHGYASSIALPLLDGRCFGVLVIYSAEPDAFDAAEIKLLEELAADLAFGIITLRIRAAHLEHEQRLQKNMLQTVQAIAGIVEMRDPYTAGHQARVAKMAREFALQMGLPGEEAQAIYLAGLVHDLGKISIPAEILSKPGRLNEVEYAMIQRHPQAGADILSEVEFSWPIAEMVLQHHERQDGSGYPKGLKGEQILLGARILCVADVVEAMASHRPYRPGLGMEAALEEIESGRGTRYDPVVADTCLSLFREHGYALPK